MRAKSVSVAVSGVASTRRLLKMLRDLFSIAPAGESRVLLVKLLVKQGVLLVKQGPLHIVEYSSEHDIIRELCASPAGKSRTALRSRE
jgi:hypothetical protein